MPTEPMFSQEVMYAATTSRRWAGLSRINTDLATLRTWDRTLSRRRRILVPVDVQAYVVGDSGEPVVSLSGTSDDPPPFADGEPLPAGVHLHWAMPDALLRGTAAEDGAGLSLPELPDRWVVVRTVNKTRERTASVTGWVIDAAHGTSTDLAEWSGDTTPVAAVTGLSGGSLLSSATYHGSRLRNALHDPLTDLADDLSQGLLSSNRATYTVAGWWSANTSDPLSGGGWGLLERMAGLSWGLTPDGEDRLHDDKDPREMRLAQMSGAVSDSDRATTTAVTKYAESKALDGDISPKVAVPFENVSKIFVGKASTKYSSLLHGSVVGVPLAGQGGLDEAPVAPRIAASLGLDVDDIAAAFAAPHLGNGSGDRLAGERLLAAFTGNVLNGLGEPDGLDDLEDREHADTFDSAPGPPLDSARPDTLREQDSIASGPFAVGRKGRSAQAGPQLKATVMPEVRRTKGIVGWSGLIEEGARIDQQAKTVPPMGGLQSRERIRPAPRIFRPVAPMIGLRGARPHPRHHGDGLYDEDGVLRCRYPGESVPGIDGTVEGVLLVPTLGNGAVPPEVVTVVREAVILDPWADAWLAAASAPLAERGPIETRLQAERVRLLGDHGSYDPSGRGAVMASRQLVTPKSVTPQLMTQPEADAPRNATARRAQARAQRLVNTERRSPMLASVASDIARFSLLRGTPPSPVGLTIWRQPWVPIFVEWQVTLQGRETLDGWTLAGRDLTGSTGPLPDDAAEAAHTVTRTITGRAPISRGVGTALTAGIRRWLVTEAERDSAAPSSSVLSDPDEEALGTLANLLDPLDVVSASLDGVREDLLGIDYQALLTMTADDETSDVKPQADRDPIPLFGGTLTLDALRVVDAFGRTRVVTVDEVATTSTREVPDKPASIVLPPRMQHGARWLLRLIGPAHALSNPIAEAPEADVNQVTPELMINPVSGFLLPDHIDESLEVFDAAGQPLGEVLHDPISAAVMWAPAPGRPLPLDAAPLDGLGERPGAQHVALLATGLVTADAQTRDTSAGVAPQESTLTAFLRAVDTTLHTVDAYAGVGAPTVAGLVGRPIAVVRATVRLQAPDDVDQVDVTAPGGPEARRAAFEALKRERVPFRLGELSRADDATLGFFVDDDYSRFHLVDKLVAGAAREVGRHRGQLGLLGAVSLPAEDPLDHPYLVLEDTLTIQVGQVRSLTILMLPAGRVHLISGLAPRKALSLAEDWVTPALRRMSPSVRIGPVLVDPAQIRLPTVSPLADDQVFTRRTGGLSWRDDPITSATSAALLPPMPHEVQEGWIRVSPSQPEAQDKS